MSTSTEENPIFSYPDLGVYPVSLTVSLPNGQTATIYKKIIIFETLDVDFTSDVALGVVDFTDTTTTSGTVTSWSWDFDDGSTSTLQNPTHTYEEVGTYSVSLLVHTLGGGIARVVHDVEILAVGEATNTAAFSYTFSGTEVTLTDLSTSIGSEIVAWEWWAVPYMGDPEDGGEDVIWTSTDQNPVVDFNDFLDIDFWDQFVDIGLTVTDDLGGTATVFYHQLNFENTAIVEGSISGVPSNAPEGCVDYIKTDPFGNAFQNYNALDPGDTHFVTHFPHFLTYQTNGVDEYTENTTTPSAYLWTFEDSSTSSDTNPVYEYPDFDTFNVSLTVTTSCGSFASITYNIVVSDTFDITYLFIGSNFPFDSDNDWYTSSEGFWGVVPHQSSSKGIYANKSVDAGAGQANAIPITGINSSPLMWSPGWRINNVKVGINIVPNPTTPVSWDAEFDISYRKTADPVTFHRWPFDNTGEAHHMLTQSTPTNSQVFYEVDTGTDIDGLSDGLSKLFFHSEVEDSFPYKDIEIQIQYIRLQGLSAVS